MAGRFLSKEKGRSGFCRAPRELYARHYRSSANQVRHYVLTQLLFIVVKDALPTTRILSTWSLANERSWLILAAERDMEWVEIVLSGTRNMMHSAIALTLFFASATSLLSARTNG
jgi:hypothetical protein